MRIYDELRFFLRKISRTLRNVVATITIPQTTTIKRTILSRRVSGMYLGLSLDFWNILLQIFVGATAFAALGLFVAQRAVIVLQDESEKEAKEALERYKSEAASKISEASTRGEQAKADASKANARALEAQLALEKFKAPRVLSEEQQASIGEKVSSFVGQRVSIGAIPTTFEHVALAEMISKALHKGGLTPDFNQGAAEVQVGPTKGVVARYVTGNERGKTFAEVLASALRDEGIAAGAVPDMMKYLIKQEEVNVEGHSWVVIVVGEKN